MGKGVNEKVVEARARKDGKKAAAAASAEAAQEEAYWDQHSNPKAKRDVKKEEAVSHTVCVRGVPCGVTNEVDL